MAVRITSWNINGIRNPFSYQPWSESKRFQTMFDILQADIVCIQELKIQKKDLVDEMVLIPGWESFFTFPVFKKGYSGVGIYTRQSKCNPVRVEEGITGILEASPGQTYLSLPPSECIGGYPELSRQDAIHLDSEGRCLVADFGGFVLIGVYCPVGGGPDREDFRVAFDRVLCERVRNLVEVLHRRVVVVGDINIARDKIDSGPEKYAFAKSGLDFKDTPTRHILDKFLKPHPRGIMVDLCRDFFPDRERMYTSWDTRLDGRATNYGSRIDYVLCSLDTASWFSEADIQPSLAGSDHCPVYGVLKEKAIIEGQETHLLDVINPPGHFINGERQSSQAPPKLKISGTLYPQFVGRRDIRNMFAASASRSNNRSLSASGASLSGGGNSSQPVGVGSDTFICVATSSQSQISSSPPLTTSAQKIARTSLSLPAQHPTKRQKTSAAAKLKLVSRTTSKKNQMLPGQQSLFKFFHKPGTAADNSPSNSASSSLEGSQEENTESPDEVPVNKSETQCFTKESTPATSQELIEEDSQKEAGKLIGSMVSKDKLTEISIKPSPPICDHQEPCAEHISQKPEANCGRSFWTCSRPAGTKANELTKTGTGEPKCNYFKWSDD